MIRWRLGLLMIIVVAILVTVWKVSRHGVACFGQTGGWTLQSPDGRIEVGTALREGVLHYAVAHDGYCFVDPSALRVELADGGTGEAITIGPVDVVGVSRRKNNETWTAVWGKSREVGDRFRELAVRLREAQPPERDLTVILRAYDEGVALRYHLPEQPSLSRGDGLHDRTEFNLAEDWPVYFVGGTEHPPVGPRRLDDVGVAMKPPLLVRADSGLSIALHEAALLDYAPMRLRRGDEPHTLRVEVDPVPFSTPFSTPWRVLLIAPEIGRLLETRLLETLSPASRIADPAWIRPGKAVWDWRIRHTTWGDVRYELDTGTFIRLIDFAAENGIAYMLIDSGWYGDDRDPGTDPTTPIPQVDIKRILAHAGDKNVGVLLYVDDTAFIRYDMDDLFATYRQWGAVGIKYGFMRGGGYEKVRKTFTAIETAGRHRLLINFHDDPVHPSGLQRTWPNLVAVEFCHAQLDAIRTFTPSDYLRTAFVHMLAGPLDMSNGFFAIDTLHERAAAGLDFEKRYPPLYATVVAEVARVLTTDTGLRVLPDAPEAYERKDDLFEFVRRLPNRGWDETRALRAEFGRVLTTARRHGQEWFVASVVNEEGGRLALDLDFLEAGTTYAVTLYEDAEDGHYRHNREAYRVRRMTVRSGDRIEFVMAPGGGHAVWIRPKR